MAVSTGSGGCAGGEVPRTRSRTGAGAACGLLGAAAEARACSSHTQLGLPAVGYEGGAGGRARAQRMGSSACLSGIWSCHIWCSCSRASRRCGRGPVGSVGHRSHLEGTSGVHGEHGVQGEQGLGGEIRVHVRLVATVLVICCSLSRKHWASAPRPSATASAMKVLSCISRGRRELFRTEGPLCGGWLK